MKKRILSFAVMAAFGITAITSCSKDHDDNGSNTDISTTSTKALNDFVNTLGEPLYADFVAKATTLNTAVQALVDNSTTANQTTAQDAWRAVRVTWEQSEGFLLGPVEDNNYDPYMDTWPTDKNNMNALLNGTEDITSVITKYTDSTADGVEYALRGFHPLEYLLWDFKPGNYTYREKTYMSILAEDILSVTKDLQNSWTKSGGYASELTNPGSTGSRYETKESAIEDIANKLIDICNEVGESKMPTPFGNTQADADSTVTESPYSHNSVTDFKNNIQGAYNSYTCTYNGTSGTSLSSLVQMNNKQLDNTLKTAFENAVNSFDGLDGYTFEMAIYTQRTKVQNIIDQIQTLKTTVEDGLVPYIQQYIKD